MLSAKGIFDFSSEARSQRLLPVFFGPIRKTRWAPRRLIGWNIFWLIFRNRWTQFKLTWQVARSQHPLPILCFSGRSKKESRWPPRSLIGWDIFNFSSETTEWNSTKLDRKQNPYTCPLPRLCFSGRSVNKKWPSWRIRKKGGPLGLLL